ncbi:hypothetical protein N7539_001433 [Penicillium diatomitis]|uniref:Uncharacterized protein n=1 Tax=Penicillium diatomitis TaxID=2819901 RepID=A0A9W9XGN4_9EURO|nr:uncharacterized protein N7539_001433 [Penicillium diatomitis]KAJ5492687.1 hypothetical protein N7539_001433 [Penicillium diatomitis]
MNRIYSGGQNSNYESTIDLVLISENLTDLIIKYTILGTEYGSDYYAIKTVFDALWSPLEY